MENNMYDQVPTKEPQRQFYYMEKAKSYVEALEKQLGRRPTFCVTTFGCQMNVELVTA